MLSQLSKILLLIAWMPCCLWGAFRFVEEDNSISIVLGKATKPAVERAAGDLVRDIEAVTSVRPVIVQSVDAATGTILVIGELGTGSAIDELVAKNDLDTSAIAQQWEAYQIQEIKDASRGDRGILTIAGSDMRGTIYGIYEVSRRIGVSPWYWWADVPVVKNIEISIAAETGIVGRPSVKYRGIFINDEDWGLQPWAAKTFEPELGDIGPKTYEKVFELLLRLKANTLWPAMHEVSRAFNADDRNAKLADAYGIVMGSSHAEPMLRNNVREWTLPKGHYNFATHPEEVLEYWDQRVSENKDYDNLYTLGMRGIHDSGMTAGGSVDEKVAFLENIITKQREMLQRHIGGDIRDIPQVFTPYKEVLPLYEAGMNVPDEVTLVWPDDNHGYIRHFATPEEQKRSGGSGIYYHLSYLGSPMAYLWLQSTPPGVVYQQMHQAWAYGARDVWIANVGDIKPAEIGMEFFLDMAWDIDRWQPEFIDSFLEYWSRQQFGEEHARDIARIMKGYYELNFQRRPEHLQWWLPRGKERSSELTGMEMTERLAAFASLTKDAKAIAHALPDQYQDAFFELVLYPVAASDAQNQRVFYAERYRNQFFRDTRLRQQYGLKARMADAELRELTHQFNYEIAGGKWKHILAVEPADSHWRSFRTAEVLIPAENMVADALDKSLFPQEDIGGLLTDQIPTKQKKTFEEYEGIVVMEAENPTRSVAGEDAQWRVIVGAGRSGDAVALYPETVESCESGDAGAAVLEYEFELTTGGDLQFTAWLLPTFPIDHSHGLRFAVSVDGSEAHLIEIHRKVKDADWTQGVLNAALSVSKAVGTLDAGKHTLRIHQIDPGVVIDKLALHFDELPKSYLGPKEKRSVR